MNGICSSSAEDDHEGGSRAAAAGGSVSDGKAFFSFRIVVVPSRVRHEDVDDSVHALLGA